jgi:hypothetical protein
VQVRTWDTAATVPFRCRSTSLGVVREANSDDGPTSAVALMFVKCYEFLSAAGKDYGERCPDFAAGRFAQWWTFQLSAADCYLYGGGPTEQQPICPRTGGRKAGSGECYPYWV